MLLVENAINFVERTPLPDRITRAGINMLVRNSRRNLSGYSDRTERQFSLDMSEFPIALATSEANDQHYEIPAAFFEHCLGSRRKYSCCYFEKETPNLDQAEVNALERTAANAQLADGQDILELGCGWGSMSLWMAETFPNARIVAVSNSSSQREFIEDRARLSGFKNLTVITADMNSFATDKTFDRIVSIEMFEHMSNWRGLLERMAGWIRQDGKAFVHVFSHRAHPYRFNVDDKADWIAQHFFTGGIMPSHNLMRQFSDVFEVEQDWRWSGTHYKKTAEAWLENFDRNRAVIDKILRDVYGSDAPIWTRRWRLFFLATAGLFGHAGGSEWGVSHYRLRPVAR